MILSSLLAVAFTFTATATGVEKGTNIEFIFAGRNSDRDYESMFLLDGSIDDFCQKAERAGLPRGRPVDGRLCNLWPVGCAIRIEPDLQDFVKGKLPDGYPRCSLIYTGGTRLPNGKCEADSEMPSALLSTYTLSQSPMLYDSIIDQGAVYGCFTAAKQLEKGKKYTFTLNWDTSSFPRHLDLTVQKGHSLELLRQIKAESEKGILDVKVGFADDVSVDEAIAVSKALAAIDSTKIKINGCSNIFYRAFIPLVKWQDRKERLHQPFELTLDNDGEKLIFIDEDWSVEGDDPKLTPKIISFDDASMYKDTDTCFVFLDHSQPLRRIFSAMSRMRNSPVRNWYVFPR